MRSLLTRMARIGRMERGKVCKMAGREHYNHQTWRSGRNAVRYVPVERVASLQEAIAGYKLFTKLAEQYADEIIRRTRAENALAGEKPQTHKQAERRKRP